MTKQELIDWASLNGLLIPCDVSRFFIDCEVLDQLLAKARVEEREACAQICAARAKDFHDLFLKYRHEEDSGATMGANQCEELIRARGKQ